MKSDGKGSKRQRKANLVSSRSAKRPEIQNALGDCSSDLSEVSDDEASSNDLSKSSDWTAVCVHLQDWEQLLRRLKPSRHPEEKAMYQHFLRNVLPVIKEDHEVSSKRSASLISGC